MQIKNGSIKQGIDNLQKASCLDTSNINVLIKLGEGYLLQDDEESAVDEAINTLQRAIMIDPDNYDCTISIAKSYEKKQDIDSAIAYVKKATQ